MQTLRKLLFLLTPEEQKNAGLLLIMILIMAFLDTIGVASILPFMAVLTNPDLIETNSILNKVFQISKIFGIETNQQFLFGLGIIVFGLLIISLIFKTLTTYMQLRFVQMREYSIGKRLIEGYLHQPYTWFLNHHSADLGKTILSEVQQLISKGIGPMMDIITKGMVVVALITLLVVTDPKLALIVGLTLIGVYVIIFYFIRTYLERIGIKRLKNNQLRFIAISEAFGAIKEIKFKGIEQRYINLFSDSAQIFARTVASSQIISQLPRYILEAVAFGGVLLLILFIMFQTGSFNNALPIISLYVFAGYRLIPALQQIYASFIDLSFISPSLNKLYDELKDLKPSNKNNDRGILLLKKSIILKNIDYNYPNTSRTALKNISINIPAKSTVGLIGVTGCGKTTVVDIILGLLEPQKGTLEVDEIVIKKENLRSWQRSIGYVPQDIYLTDNTILSNIAFGVEPKDINQNLIEQAAKIANLHDFVVNELPKKYQTVIGERGIRLSGGQRQRIGIARALYNEPQVLILDEATSALDNETERVVMDAVSKLNKHITIIIIAHRLSTLQNCDSVFLLENGKLKKQGTFDEIISYDEILSKDVKY